jgi:hypothetical protein
VKLVQEEERVGIGHERMFVHTAARYADVHGVREREPHVQ